MKVELILCDASQRDPLTGKVSMLGAGWTTLPVAAVQTVSPHSVVAMVHVPWEDSNRKHKMTFDLVDDDTRTPVEIIDPTTGAAVSLAVNAEFEVGRPPGIPAGMDLLASFAFNVGPGVPLGPDKTYSWVCKINGAQSAQATFYTVPAPTPSAA